MGDQQISHREDYIDLVEYAKVLIRRKRVAMSVFLTFILIGVAYILLAPKIYEITMIMQPPIAGSTLSINDSVDSSENIKSLIINNVFDPNIIKSLSPKYRDIQPVSPKFNIAAQSRSVILGVSVTIPPRSNFLRISINEPEKNINMGIDILTELHKEISRLYGDRINFKNASIDKKVQVISNDISITREKIRLLETQLKEVKSREDKLAEEARGIGAFTEKPLNTWDFLSKENMSMAGTPSPLYANIVQLHFNYLNQLENKLSDLMIKKENLLFDIKAAQTDIGDKQIEIDGLNMSKVNISNVKLLQEPLASVFPVWPKKKVCLVLVIILGLAGGVLAAFVQDFWINRIKT
jgi:LPS O-antigen subunit length determinant protein (WzzB/FepE family)